LFASMRTDGPVNPPRPTFDTSLMTDRKAGCQEKKNKRGKELALAWCVGGRADAPAAGRAQPIGPASPIQPPTTRASPFAASPMRVNGRMDTIRIATRKSPLALWQSDYVAARLGEVHPGLHVELIPMSTRGDEVLDRSLAAIGGKGLFLKELELAILRGEADCAVHSLKDVPMDLDVPFALPAILPRHDPADGFVSNLYASLDALPLGARVG